MFPILKMLPGESVRADSLENAYAPAFKYIIGL
jgi:hypothetical protein